MALTHWMADNGPTAGLGPGLFGASTGAAATLIAAATRAATVQTVVSRGDDSTSLTHTSPRCNSPHC